jgi:hypothetical protein
MLGFLGDYRETSLARARLQPVFLLPWPLLAEQPVKIWMHSAMSFIALCIHAPINFAPSR